MGTRLTMPAEYYAQQPIRSEILGRAARKAGFGQARDLFALCASLETSPEPSVNSLAHFLDLQESGPSKASWLDQVTRSISNFCAGYYDRGQALWQKDRALGLYASWRDQLGKDCQPSILRNLPACQELIKSLPESGESVVAWASELLKLEAPASEAYLTALLLELNGWASWCAFLDWDQKLLGREATHTLDFLAIRLAWDMFLWQDVLSPHGRNCWLGRTIQAAAQLERPKSSPHWFLQEALEQEFQLVLNSDLARSPVAATSRPDFQFVFCIDVRSEPMRRALEQVSDAVQTLGFAGFFGIPAAYRPAGARETIAHLPGLLAPQMEISETVRAEARRDKAEHDWTWRKISKESLSTFSFVESLGLFHLWPLFKDALGIVPESPRPAELRIQLEGDDAVALADRSLRGMSLVANFAPSVLLVGHEASCQNNPQAAGLQCGACGGQSGEVSAMALAELLNRPQVREGLSSRGIIIPTDTTFHAAVHNTTLNTLRMAGRQSKSPPGLQTIVNKALSLVRDSHASVRSRDWAETRPEWGLLNNAGLIAAPRARTRGLNLQGRCFLHEYDCGQDQDGSILELIMTAPMVVAHWINLQYYASTVDPLRWGSGNKTLHNVVGGGLGLYEGSGGDLRIGLARQSLHDGKKWVHAPLRLSVWLEAEAQPIERILAKHPHLQKLVSGQWIFLFRIDPQSNQVFQKAEVGWVPALEFQQREYSNAHISCH